MSNYITWNGIRSDSLGLTVEHYPNLNRPARKYTVADVPGRNGSAYILQNAWTEVVQSYDISAKSPVASFKGVAEWLSSANGYAVLQDSYDPTIYRMAVCVNPFEVENSLNRAGRALIQFNCRPERYIVSPDQAVTPPGTLLVTNSTIHEAHPLLKIEGQGYPSMLPFNDRTNVLDSYDNYFNIEGLGAKKIRYNFIGLSDAVPAEVEYNIFKDATAVSGYAGWLNGVSFTAAGNEYGIGLNRSVQPNTTYTVSFYYHSSANTKNGKLSVITTDKNGFITGKAGSLDVSPAAQATLESLTFTTGSEAYWAVLIFLPTEAGSYNFQDVMMNLGEEALPYAPYSDTTASAFTIGDCIVRLSELADLMYIDCETMNAYRNRGENLNAAVTITDLNGNLTAKFPRLVPGATEIDLSGPGVNWITKVTVSPRFWTL